MALTIPIDSYISLVAARAYATLMGLDLPAVDVDAELVLKKAAIYIDRLYGHRFIGNRTTTIGLYWPRTVVSYYDSSGNYRSDLTYTSVPLEVGQAQVELAAMMYTNEFDPFVQPEPRLKSEQVKIEGIETKVEYADAFGYNANPFYKLDILLAPLLTIISSKRITMTRGA